MSIDFSVLNKYSEHEAKEFDKEIGAFLDGSLTKENPSKEAVAFFYLTLHKKENERRGLSLEESHYVIRGLQGKVLTLIEASITDTEQRKALKDIINNYFSNAQSLAQDYDWGRYDNCSEPQQAQPAI